MTSSQLIFAPAFALRPRLLPSLFNGSTVLGYMPISLIRYWSPMDKAIFKHTGSPGRVRGVFTKESPPPCGTKVSNMVHIYDIHEFHETCHSITFIVLPVWSIHTKDESKRGIAFAFIFGVNWLWRCGVTASFGVFFFHDIKCNGMTSFMESMSSIWASGWPWWPQL